MKAKRIKLSAMLKTIFGYGFMICLFAGGLSFFGYLAALFIGGESAAALCRLIYKDIIPVIIYATTCLVLLGVIAMHLAGEKTLTPGSKKK